MGLVGCSRGEEEPGRDEPVAAPLAILVLGGTGFIGPHIVREARRRGHQVTLFNRGRTNPGLFDDLEQLIGDRNGDLTALEGRRWDAAIDTATLIPRWVRTVGEVIGPNVDQYLFVSTLSVHADFSQMGIDETSPLATMDDPTVEEVTGETYGPLKVLSEQAAEETFPGRTTVLRPGLIVGPGDPTDRFTYWPVRVDRGGEILAPNTPDDHVLVIDARDLAAFAIRCLEERATDVYSVVGPDYDLTMGGLLEAAGEATTTEHSLTWVPWEFLEAQGVAPWSDMPVWMPPTGAMAGFGSFNRDKAIAAGLRFRPLAETCRDTLAWFREERDGELRTGISPEREAEVLAAWHAAEGAGGGTTG